MKKLVVTINYTLELLTSLLCDNSPRVSLELNDCFYNERVVLGHPREVFVSEHLLDVVASVVDLACTNIARRAFKRKGGIVHLGPVFLNKSLIDFDHGTFQLCRLKL